MTDRKVMQQALRAFNLYLDWDGKDSSMLATFDIAVNIVKDKLNAAIAQPAVGLHPAGRYFAGSGPVA